MKQLRQLRSAELKKVSEVSDRAGFLQKTLEAAQAPIDSATQTQFNRLITKNLLPDKDNLRSALQGGLLTYLLHW